MLLLIEPRPVWAVQDHRQVVLAAANESGMEKRELLIQKLRSGGRVVCQCGGCRSEALEYRLGGDVGDVVEHLPVLGLLVELLGANAEDDEAFAVRVPDGHADTSHVLARLEPPPRPRGVVEAEELVARIDDEIGRRGIAVDREDVRALLFEDDLLVHELETVSAVQADGLTVSVAMASPVSVRIGAETDDTITL